MPPGQRDDTSGLTWCFFRVVFVIHAVISVGVVGRVGFAVAVAVAARLMPAVAGRGAGDRGAGPVYPRTLPLEVAALDGGKYKDKPRLELQQKS